MLTKKDLNLRLELLKKQLELINLYEDDFVNKIGIKETLQLIDDILDEIIEIKIKLKSKK